MHSKASTRERIKRLNEQHGKTPANAPTAGAPPRPTPEEKPLAMPLREGSLPAAPSRTAAPVEAAPLAIAPVVTHRCRSHQQGQSVQKEEPCPECRARKRQEKRQANLARAAKWQADLNQGRLPLWLDVHSGLRRGNDEVVRKLDRADRRRRVKVFEDSAGAVVSLLFRLDKQYRSFAAVRAGK